MSPRRPRLPQLLSTLVARTRPWLVRPWMVALVLGAAACVYAIPLRMLDPTDITWMNRDDTLAHWLGWEQFRDSPVWQLPLGKSEPYGLENSTSIVFSDSIPLVALLLHPIEGLLPTPFQYLGLWSLLCFLLQGYYGYRLSALVLRPAAALAATGLFLASAPMLNRIHVHSSLLGHWLLVAGLYYYFTDGSWRWRRWAVLIAVASLVHGYLFAMTAVLWLAHLGKIAALGGLRGGRRVVLVALGRAVLAVAAVGAVMYLAGYFGVKGPNYHIYGNARYDLRNPLCSYGIWSMATRQLPCGAKPADWDGQAWLGLGGLAVLGIGVVALLIRLIARRAACDLRSRMPRWPLLVACLLLVWFAATNEVVFGGKELFQYPLPKRWLKLAETFRASGRMIWPVFYAEVFAILALFARAVPPRLHVWILAPLVLYQAYDMRHGIEVVNADIPTGNRIHAVSSPAWERLAHYDRLISVPAVGGQEGWQDLVWRAARSGVASNIGLFNRTDKARADAGRMAWLRTVVDGPLDPRSVYVFPEQGLWDAVRAYKGPDDVALVADGHFLLFPGGRRLGLADDATPALPALPLGVWRKVGQGGDGNRYLTNGWSWIEDWGRWNNSSLAGLTVRQPASEIGRDRRIVLEIVVRRPERGKVQPYRVRVWGKPLTAGQLGPRDTLLTIDVPAAMNTREWLFVELDLPMARLDRVGRELAFALWRIWISDQPGTSPSLLSPEQERMIEAHPLAPPPLLLTPTTETR